MSKLNRDAKEFIRLTRDLDDPSPARKARIRSAMLVRIGAGVATGAGASAVGAAAGAAAKTTAATSASVLFLKTMTVVVVVGLAGGYAAVKLSKPPAPQDVALAASSTLAPPPSAAVIPSPPTEPAPASASASASAPPSRSFRAAPVLAPAPSGADLETEIAVLQQAREAMSKGDPDFALKVLEEHADRHRDGAMAEERTAATILALCRVGRQIEAKRIATSFLQAHPQSPLAARVRSSCAFAPPAASERRP